MEIASTIVLNLTSSPYPPSCDVMKNVGQASTTPPNSFAVSGCGARCLVEQEQV